MIPGAQILAGYIDSFSTSVGDSRALYMHILAQILGGRGADEETCELFRRTVVAECLTVESLIKDARNTVPEIREAAYELISVLIGREWYHHYGFHKF